MLQVSGVHKYFGGVHALNNVSCEIGEGEVLALVGNNGAGKSTLMKCVSGALQADSGDIAFHDSDISRGSPQQSRAVGIEMIYQDLNLCGLQDVVTNAFLGREKKNGIFLERSTMAVECEAAFEKLGIEIPIRSIVGNLSGGQQQSIAIARAMISDPKLLIMDEPTAALAVKEVEGVLGHILTMKNRGISVVIISHRLSDIFEVADRIIVMTQGEVRYELSPQETDLKDLTLKIVGE